MLSRHTPLAHCPAPWHGAQVPAFVAAAAARRMSASAAAAAAMVPVVNTRRFIIGVDFLSCRLAGPLIAQAARRRLRGDLALCVLIPATSCAGPGVAVFTSLMASRVGLWLRSENRHARMVT